MASEYVTLKELATRLGLDRSNLRKQVIATGFHLASVRTVESRNQLTLALKRQDAETFVELRQSRGFDLESQPPKVVNGESGYFYLVQLVPDIAPNRVKVGFASDAEARLQAHRTSAPTAKLVSSWPCKRTWEDAAIASVTRVGCFQISREVYDCDSIESVEERANTFFALMPAVMKA